MADSTNPVDTQDVGGNQAVTPSELLKGQAKWWKERVDALNSNFGFYGRDLRNQDDLLKTVMGMEEDITFLLRYVRSLTELIDLQPSDPDTTLRPSESPTLPKQSKDVDSSHHEDN